MHFIIFLDNTFSHFSTGFTPHLLTFETEARLRSELLYGAPSFVPESINQHGRLSASSDSSSSNSASIGVHSLLHLFFRMHSISSQVRKNLHSFHQREKDRYDLGAVEPVFHERDVVRIRLKARQ